jgi:cellulose synthase (UDP-forming)
VESFRVQTPYHVGDLPWWLWPQAWVSGQPLRALGVLLLAGIALGFPAFWMLRRRALSRLRGHGDA